MEVGKRSREVVLMFALAMVAALVVLVWGGYRMSATHDPGLLVAGIIAVTVVVTGYAIARELGGILSRSEQTLEKTNALVSERLEQFSVMLNMISEQQLISERAKEVAFRENDHNAMVRAIREEMNHAEFDAALLLVNEMENTYAYRAEADGLRTEIATMRDGVVRRAVAEIVSEIDHNCMSEKWDEAGELARQAAMKYPGNEVATNLPQQVAQRKEAIKQQLLARWRDALAKKDTDTCIDIMRVLDMYVTPSEVAELKDGALEVFKARIEQLRDQFKQAVHQKRWQEACSVGETLVQEFPTSKVADEVRDMLLTLRARASEEPVATVAT